MILMMHFFAVFFYLRTKQLYAAFRQQQLNNALAVANGVVADQVVPDGDQPGNPGLTICLKTSFCECWASLCRIAKQIVSSADQREELPQPPPPPPPPPRLSVSIRSYCSTAVTGVMGAFRSVYVSLTAVCRGIRPSTWAETIFSPATFLVIMIVVMFLFLVRGGRECLELMYS